ncbi:hypothetical protein D3C80_1755460 [compost metagenome]
MREPVTTMSLTVVACSEPSLFSFDCVCALAYAGANNTTLAMTVEANRPVRLTLIKTPILSNL